MAETTVERPTAFRVIGKPIPRVDGIEKVTGAAKFAADYSFPGMVWGKVLRSPYAHARIKRIDTSKAERYPGVVCVLTGQDILDINREPTARHQNPLAINTVLFYGQPVAAVAAETKEIAEEALGLIEVEYEPLPVLLDPVEAMKPGAYQIRHDGAEHGVDRSEAAIHTGGVGLEAEQEATLPNVASQVHFTRGDVAQGFAEADYIVEGTFRVGTVHQGYLEPHAAIAHWDAAGNVTVWATTQGQFFMRDMLARLLRMPISKIRVIGTEIGGGFGGKFGLILALTVLLARKARRPVKLVLSRSEELIAGTPAPYTVVELKLGCTKDGRLTAMQGRVIMDTGAFPGAPMTIATILLAGSYRIPNLDLYGYEVLTNKASVGAYRAPGAPEVAFAVEALVDELAKKCGMDPIRFRLLNAVEEGDKWPNGQVLPPIGLKECLQRLLEHPDWTAPLGPNEGKGVAVGAWPGGAGGASAVVRANPDGTFTVLTGAVNLTGTTTAFAQIAAEELGVPIERIQVVQGDTSEAPVSPASGGSQITYTMGHAVSLAAREVRQQLLAQAARALEVAVEDLEVENGVVRVKGVPSRRISYAKLADQAAATVGPIVGHGSHKPPRNAPGYAACLARVRVDPETGQVKVLKLVGVQDVGRAINPLAVEGQIQGGTVQGMGMALLEEIVYGPDGRVLNPSLLDYRMATCADVPTVEAQIVEVPSPTGPYGARIVGEPSIVPPGAAIANAIADATGVRLTEFPATPERVFWALRRAGAAG